MSTRPLAIVLILALCASAIAADEQFSWQKTHIKILPNGDMQWQPEPFVFRAGASVRYIDYDNGDDSADGRTKATAWKHHPWDRDAKGKAAEASGMHTYVFKRGVIYRGQLLADESGKPGDPIILTSDPSWGAGEARVYGSTRLPARWVKADTVDRPQRLPEPGKVWAIDLKALELIDGNGRIAYTGPNPDGRGAGRPDTPFTGLFIVGPDGSATKQHLARWPDWQKGDDNFAMDYWHAVDGQKTVKHSGVETGGLYDEVLKGYPEDYFTGGTIWIQYRSLMGTPTPSKIPATREVGRGGKKTAIPYYHPDQGVLLKRSQGGYGKGGLRYLLEDLPQFLDAAGEFYVDSQRGKLFYRPADGVDPNDLHMELTTRVTQIRIPSRSHIEISGLAFAFTNGATIDMEDDVTDINIHHCTFYNVPGTAISGGVSRSDEKMHVMDRIRVADCDFRDVWTTAVSLRGEWIWNQARHRGKLGHVEIMRNNVYNTGMRHAGSRWSNVPAMSFNKLQTGEIAGNVVRRSFGSGIVVLGGKEGNLGPYDARDADLPLIRILVHHNKTEDTALGVNDYGGLALWQGGPTYCFGNNIGNSPGHMPSGFFGMTHPINLSYPLYLDGAFKQYSFNNVIWGRTVDTKDPFANTTPGYFQVFGFLNHFTNNTVYRNAKGVGGSSGNRCDIVSNVFDEISKVFLANNREGDPSLLGGGDDASSGIRGIPSLGFAHNLFHGPAEAGVLLKKESRRREAMEKAIDAETIEQMARQMRNFPIRVPDLGRATDQPIIQGAPDEGPIDELTADVDFHPSRRGPAIDAGATYFVPWSLYATVGEWNFNANHAEPDMVTDYHWYMSEAHFHRSMYEYIPSFDLRINRAGLGDYTDSPSESWIKGAMKFDGKRFGSYPDELLRSDIVISLGSWDRSQRRRRKPPESPWKVDKPSRGNRYAKTDYMRYPAQRRKTLIITTQNVLIEAHVRIDRGTTGAIAGKHDGRGGYRLLCNEAGQAEFVVSSAGRNASVTTAASINDGQWRHVLAEIDRGTGRMTIYLDGKQSGQGRADLPADASLDCEADFLVGKANDDSGYLTGAIDFLRVCRGTLADARTTIEELYAWQTAGPVKHDLMGRNPRGRRDAGALELTD